MYDPDTYAIVEELRNVRSTIRRFGIYFVVLTLLPILWAVFVMALMGSFVGGVGNGIAEGTRTATNSFSQRMDQAVKDDKIRELTKDLERVTRLLEQNQQPEVRRALRK